MFKFMKSLIETDTGKSSKSFALVMSTIISFISGLVICFVICFDVLTNGYVKTDLESTGIFMLCIGGYMAGSGIPKIFGERAYARFKKYEVESEGYDEEDDDYRNRDKRRTNRRTRAADVSEEEALCDA